MKFTPILIAMLPMLAVTASQAAVYQVVELGAVQGFKSSFAAAINDSNQVVGTNSSQFNYPIDLAAIDYSNTLITNALTAAEIEEVKKGNVNAKALAVLLNYVTASTGDFSVQRFADAFAVRLDTKERLPLRQTTLVNNYEYLLDINNQGQILGYATAPFTLQRFTPAVTTEVPNPVAVNLWVPESGYQLGVVVNQSQKQLLPPLFTGFGGGYSLPTAMNNNGRIVGIGSVGMPEATQTTITTSCNGATQPVALCHYRNAISGSMYTSGGLVWQLNAAGVPGTPTQLPFLGEKNTGLPHNNSAFTAVNYISQPEDINDLGVIVGSSTYTDSSIIRFNGFTGRDEVFTAPKAVFFIDNKVESFISNSEWESNTALAINNKNIIVGTARKEWFRGPDRFFIYDLAAKQLTFPTDFFGTATTKPAAINDNNMVVGTTEAFLPGSSVRRNVGFMYDISTKTFTNLNTFLPCNSGYSIVDAVDINNRNVIVATAVKSVDRRDVKGDIVRDAQGNALKEEVAVAVQLVPVAGGTVDKCDTTADTTYERKGGSLSFLALLLLPVVMFRRRWSLLSK